MTKSNPMLAFGLGPEGVTCRECRHCSLLNAACFRRSGENLRRRWKFHLADWPACKLFAHRLKGYRKAEGSETNS